MWKRDYNKDKKDTSWQKVSKWYGELVGDKGHYYHQQVVIPNTIRLLGLDKNSSLLDLGCGEGVLARAVLPEVSYMGVDLSADLIRMALAKSKNKRQEFVAADATKDLPIRKNDFSHGAVILALQNIKNPEGLFRNIFRHMRVNGRMVMVINHPCFRIPRQSGWGTDDQNKSQFRKIQSYMSRLEIPVAANPGRGQKSEMTWSFHYPLGEISEMINRNGMVIEKIEEWTSDKKSSGGAAKMENRARNEIPLFMALVLRRIQ